MAYFITCSFDSSLNKYESFRGPNCVAEFLESLVNNCKNLCKTYLCDLNVPLNISEEEKNEARKVDFCCICKKQFKFDDFRVFEHTHWNGKFNGMAHNECNLKYFLPKTIPVFFHNFAKYDSHLIIRELAKIEPKSKLSIIGNNTETFVLINKSILICESSLNNKGNSKNNRKKKQYLCISFRDSFKFLSSSLDSLVKNLNDDSDVDLLRQEFLSDLDMSQSNLTHEEKLIKIRLLLRKGVFPYEYVKSFDDYEIESLPASDYFSSSLNGFKQVSKEEYDHAEKVFLDFNCNNLGEYSDLYLKTDVMLLTSIFQKFRNDCREWYGIDPANFSTLPSFAWQVMLKVTKEEIEYIKDIEKIRFIENGIRGGTCHAAVRHVVARNKYIEGFDPLTEDSNFLFYVDVNNLYGTAFCQNLPTGNYKWLNKQEIENLTTNLFHLNPESDKVGYILKVDIEYPDSLHDFHNNFPFLPQHETINKVSKLCCTLNSKIGYIIYYSNLIQAISHGLKLTKVHQVLSFTQKPWMKKYIELNNLIRETTQFETVKALAKNMNNIIYGRSIMNVRKHRDIKLCTSWENIGKKRGLGYYIASGRLKRMVIVDENLVICELKKLNYLFNSPIQIGMVVLEKSKYFMYDLFYDKLAKIFPNQSLVYTDTDSFVLNIRTKDMYSDIRSYVNNPNLSLFDTSDYSENNPFGFKLTNKKKLGALKDELKGNLMTHFIGLRSKCYSFQYQSQNGVKQVKKSKGVKHYIVNELSFSEYEIALNDRFLKMYKEQYMIRSKLHTIYTINQHKVALNSNDDKRYILADNVNTLALGHRKIEKKL